MVFTRLGLGLIAGCAIPLVVDQTIYMTIANSFLRPHLKFRIEKEALNRDKAITTQMLDSYIKDVVGSFLLFFVVIGPAIYYVYFDKNKNGEKDAPQKDVIGNVPEDKYSKMIKQMSPEPQKKISFEEYEQFMRKLEKDNKLDKLELTNPKSAIYQELMSREDKRL